MIFMESPVRLQPVSPDHPPHSIKETEMEHNHILVLTSSLDEMELGIGDILQSLLRGSLIRVEAQTPRAPAHADPFATRVRPERLQQLYYSIASARQVCTALVAGPCVDAVLRFLDDHQGTTDDFAHILCSATPDLSSQKTAIQTITRLLEMGVQPDQIGLVCTQTPAGTPVDQAFPELARLRDERLPNLAFEVILEESSVFTRAREQRIPITGVLSQQVDFEADLRQARQAGAEEASLQALAKKVLAQRALRGQTQRILKAFAALPFCHVPPLAGQSAGVVPSRPQEEDVTVASVPREVAGAHTQQ
jgi:hypothetical protein